MAKNTGNGYRKGAVSDRTQVLNPKNERYTKRDSDTGQFMDVKSEKNKKFKGITDEK